ncbi:hypothetical protein SK128_005811 [Halocaridina rubra]|uniref:Equilibrative nucleoside transporter 3 n=1 Tax=Halocaridina rubra TaxID=373956 RepID=A0AAN8X2M3_HALRR
MFVLLTRSVKVNICHLFQYWQYKLRNVTRGDDWDNDDSTLTTLQVTFTPTLVIISNVFCTVFLIVTTGIVKRVSEWARHVGSLALSLLAMIIITVLTFVNTDSFSVAVLQGSSYGLAGMFPASCMSGMISGQAVAGIFSSLAMIISLLVGGDDVTSALIFFVIADVFLVITIIGYIYLTKTTFYDQMKIEATKTDIDGKQNTKNDWKSYLLVFKKVWLMGTTLGGTLFFTLMIYPAVLVYITSVYPTSQWTEVYFQPTITFLLFNIGDWAGREAPRLVKWPGPDGWLLHIFGAARVVFIPLLMLCHGENKTFPTVLDHDAYYIILLFFFAITNGYVGTLAMIYYPGLVEDDEIELAGTIMAALLGIGMVIGSLLSPAFVALWGPT